MRRATLLFGAILLCAACASPTATGGARTPGPTAAAPATEPASGSSIEASASPESELVGSWTREQSCKQQLAAFEAAGLADSHASQWVRDSWVDSGKPAGAKDLCTGTRPPEQHTHEFSADGQFGSLDAEGNPVDEGDYVIVDGDTVAFPSHASDFGYDGDLTVGYRVKGDTATFAVTLPADCSGPCRDAYAWALSAFFDGREWTRQ